MADYTRMKDSGVPWIGEIPDGWEVLAIKWNFDIKPGATPRSDITEYWDGDIIWITPADFKTENMYVNQGKRNISESGYTACSAVLIPEESLIFSKRGTIGTVVINTVKLCTNQGCLACIPYKTANTKFFYFVISIFTEQFELVSSGTTFKEITKESFSSFKFPFPSYSEQHAIATYLDEKCAAIDELITHKQALIADLEAYRKSLIFECVTGKRRVGENA